MFKRAKSVTLNMKIYKTNIVFFCDVTNQNMLKHTTVWLSFNPFLEQQDKKMLQTRFWNFRPLCKNILHQLELILYLLKWTKLLTLEITIFVLKMMVKNAFECFIMKSLHEENYFPSMHKRQDFCLNYVIKITFFQHGGISNKKI